MALPLLVFFSCNDPVPHIIITSPQAGEEYFRDIDIKVEIIVTDTKGKSLPVELYANDTLCDVLQKAPYHFTIKAGKLLPGIHKLKIRVKDVEDTRTITVKKAASECPDFITFTDRIIPPELYVTDWILSTSNGVDDSYYLATVTAESQVSATKTCRNISFYLKGLGTIYLYMDDKKDAWKIIELGIKDSTSVKPQGWTLYEFTCTPYRHIFTWKFLEGFPASAGLDAIRFEK